MENTAPGRRRIPRRVSQPSRDDDVVKRSQGVFAAFHRHDCRARKHRDGLADRMRVIRELRTRLEGDQSCHEVARAVVPADKAIQRNARSQFDGRVCAPLIHYFPAIGTK